MEQDHTFFVSATSGDEMVWVHNAGPAGDPPTPAAPQSNEPPVFAEMLERISAMRAAGATAADIDAYITSMMSTYQQQKEDMKWQGVAPQIRAFWELGSGIATGTKSALEWAFGTGWAAFDDDANDHLDNTLQKDFATMPWWQASLKAGGNVITIAAPFSPLGRTAGRIPVAAPTPVPAAAPAAVNPIQSLPRVGSALKNDPYHAFPNIVDNYASMATQTQLQRGATLYQVEGSLNGVAGRFEWIVQNGNVTHRLFVPGGTLNGLPILP